MHEEEEPLSNIQLLYLTPLHAISFDLEILIDRSPSVAYRRAPEHFRLRIVPHPIRLSRLSLFLSLKLYRFTGVPW